MYKIILTILLTTILLIFITIFPITTSASFDIPYMDENGDLQICPNAIELIGGSAVTLIENWYFISGTHDFSGAITISGDVHLILADDCNLTVIGNDYEAGIFGNSGINVMESNSLTIYAQSNNSNMGKLTATGGSSATISGGAGIGSNSGGDKLVGNITINGGNITAIGGNCSAGIGGGDASVGGIVNINGGIVTAIGGNGNYSGAGIGGGVHCAGGTVIINGGIVTAIGGNGNYSGAGIGGAGGYSSGGAGGIININGGIVIANGGSGNIGIGAGIGGGFGNDFIGEPGTLTLPENGNGIIFASSISDTATANKLSGILFDDARGSDAFFYGDEIIPTDDFTIPAGKTLTVPDGAVLNISEEITLTNEGTVTNEGILINNGTVVDNGIFTNKNILISEEKISVMVNNDENDLDIIAFYNEDNLLTNVIIRTESGYVSKFDIPPETRRIAVMKWKNDPIQPSQPAKRVVKNGFWVVDK